MRTAGASRRRRRIFERRREIIPRLASNARIRDWAWETSFTRRGFRSGDPQIRQHLERIGRIFVHGYHAALAEDRPERLALGLNRLEPELHGFAFEGAGMGFCLLDLLTPWNCDRLGRFLVGPAAPHAYMVHVGAGWALAQLRRRVDRAFTRLDPLLGWLAVDGYGFHHGYFRWPDSVERQRVPRRLSGYARRAFDQGLGRSLWFVEGAEGDRISATIARFPQARHADLWSGVGLACAYAGGVDRAAIEALVLLAGAHHPQFAQGMLSLPRRVSVRAIPRPTPIWRVRWFAAWRPRTPHS